MNNKKEIDDLISLAERAMDRQLINIIGLPLLICRIAQNAVIIKNNPDINTMDEANDFLITDLTSYSLELKNNDCVGYMFIDSYIKNLIEIK